MFYDCNLKYCPLLYSKKQVKLFRVVQLTKFLKFLHIQLANLFIKNPEIKPIKNPSYDPL